MQFFNCFIRSGMSIQYYLHEKAEESRHNELIAYIMFLAGSVFFVGGILSSLSFGTEPSWLFFIPYVSGNTQALFLELAFLIVGLFLIVVGIGAGLHYYRSRGSYMNEIAGIKETDTFIRERRLQTRESRKRK